jgi:hypothetical protein
MADDYREVIQDFFRMPSDAPTSVRENVINAGLSPGIETPAQKNQKENIKRKNELRRRTLQMLMATDQGREWLYDMLNECNTFGTPFNPDTHATAYNCGALYIGRNLENDILRFCPDLYSVMRKESLERDTQAEQYLNEDDAKPVV